MTDEELCGHFLAEDLVNAETGEIYAEAGDEITEKLLEPRSSSAAMTSCRSSTSTMSTYGRYIRNTLAVDKNKAARTR